MCDCAGQYYLHCTAVPRYPQMLTMVPMHLRTIYNTTERSHKFHKKSKSCIRSTVVCTGQLYIYLLTCTDGIDATWRLVDAKAKRRRRKHLSRHVTSLEKFDTSNDVGARIVTSTCVKLSTPHPYIHLKVLFWEKVEKSPNKSKYTRVKPSNYAEIVLNRFLYIKIMGHTQDETI